MDVLFAAEILLPAHGGAERFIVEALEALRPRHSVRAVYLEPVPHPERYWEAKRLRREEVGRRVERALEERRADVVVTQLHAAPAAIAAARTAGVPSVLALPSYESFCKHAFDAGSECRPESRCRACPATAALGDAERHELWRSRDEHEASLAAVSKIVALSHYLGAACSGWCGREPDVLYPVARASADARARPDGPVVAAAVQWSARKGADVVAALGSVETIAGARSIEEFFRGAGILVVPSQWPEPFGRIAFEAMSAGLPTLASAVGGLAEFVPPEQLVVDYADPAAWRAAIAELREPAQWHAARERGLRAATRVLEQAPLQRFEELLVATAVS